MKTEQTNNAYRKLTDRYASKRDRIDVLIRWPVDRWQLRDTLKLVQNHLSINRMHLQVENDGTLQNMR